MDLIEDAARAVHEEWLASKRAVGVTSRILEETGEELMVDYDELSETAKELDRATVRTSIRAIRAANWRIVQLTDVPPGVVEVPQGVRVALVDAEWES